MRTAPRTLPAVLAFVCAAAAGLTTTPSRGFATTPESVEATVRMERPERHFYSVEMVFPPQDTSLRRIQMASWTPGSYRIRDFAKHVDRFHAYDPSGNELEWHKTDKATWEIETPQGGAFAVKYEFFAYDFSVRTSYLDSFYGFINPACLFFYEPARTTTPYLVRVFPAPGWKVATPLSPERRRYRAADWDELVDSPFVFGPLRSHEFEVDGIPHEWVIVGDVDMNEDEMVSAMQTICKTVGAMFGGYPFSHYKFFSQFRLSGGGGGLEHRNSTMLHGSSDSYHEKDGWDRYLGVIIHEYFHAWNVKAIHDRSLGPFDYQAENYTDLLWLHEGWTDYYDTILMGRAGFWKAKELREKLAKSVDAYIRRPGTREQSLADASFNAWIHSYQPSKTWRNSRVSYYSGGAMSALALDLRIRQETSNQRSLDDVMRMLYRDYAAQGHPIDFDIVVGASSKVLGADARPFFDEYVRGTKEFDWETLLGYAGLSMVYEEETDEEEEPYAPNAEVDLGIETRSRDGAVIVNEVLRGGKAWEAGLDYGDEIIAVQDRRVRSDNFEKALGWYQPDDVIEVLLSRGGKIMSISIDLAAAPQKLTLKPVEEPSELQKEISASLFGSDDEESDEADADN